MSPSPRLTWPDTAVLAAIVACGAVAVYLLPAWAAVAVVTALWAGSWLLARHRMAWLESELFAANLSLAVARLSVSAAAMPTATGPCLHRGPAEPQPMTVINDDGSVYAILAAGVDFTIHHPGGQA